MARRQEGILRQIRDEAKHQLRGFPRELKHQLRGFGSEANYQLNRGWVRSSPDRFSGHRSDVKDDAAQGLC